MNLFLGISGIKIVVIAVNQNNNFIKSQSFYHDPRIKIVAGGSTRSESVFNAMAKVGQDIEIVVIHDAARPWLKKTHFEDLLSKFASDQSIEGVFPVISATDSLRMKQGADVIPVERENFFHVQTPQIFYRMQDLNFQRCQGKDQI